MNREACIELADFIESHNCTLEMSSYIDMPYSQSIDSFITDFDSEHTCGTAACIAGWTALKYRDDYLKSHLHIESFAARKLGLDGIEQSWLFTPDGYDNPPENQRDRALAVLRGTLPLDSDWLHPLPTTSGNLDPSHVPA